MSNLYFFSANLSLTEFSISVMFLVLFIKYIHISNSNKFQKAMLFSDESDLCLYHSYRCLNPDSLYVFLSDSCSLKKKKTTKTDLHELISLLASVFLTLVKNCPYAFKSLEKIYKLNKMFWKIHSLKKKANQ